MHSFRLHKFTEHVFVYHYFLLLLKEKKTIKSTIYLPMLFAQKIIFFEYIL